MNRPSACSGFSLITMSIILTAAAIVFVSFLPGKEAGDYNAKTVSNVKRLEKIEEAMRGFMVGNGRRPCPAQGSYDINSHYFGLEAGSPGSCVGNTSPIPNAPMGPDSGTGYIVSGTIPTKSLGLPDEYAFDQFGRRFTYVVDTRATRKGLCVALNGVGEAAAGPGDLVIKDGTGGNIIDHTMYAYISHGPSGFGAFPAQGGTPGTRINTGSADQDMLTNAGVDSNFTYNTANFTNVRVKKPSTSTFDDLVWYRDDLKNTCCLGPACIIDGFVIEGGLGGAAGWAAPPSFNTMDFNQDGRPDLVINAPFYNYNRGALFILYGLTTKGYYPAVISTSYFTGSQGTTYTGTNSSNYGDLYGWRGFTVADLNGDSKPDLLISGNVNAYGGAFALYNEKPALTTLNQYINGTGTYGFTIGSGYADYSYYPYQQAAAGDINKDGYTDIVITDPAANKIFIVWGQAAGWPADTVLSSPDGTHVTEIDGVLVSSGSSRGLVQVADINGDGYADIIIGTASTTSKAYVIFGGPTTAPYGAWPATFNISGLAGYNPASPGANGTNGFVISDSSGSNMAVITTGDFNGDGYKDIVVSIDPYQHHNLLLYGGPGPKTGANSWASSWPATLSVAESTGTVNGKNDGTSGAVFTLNYLADNCTVVSDIGDVNGDGIDDIGCEWNTFAAVIFGKKTWPGTSSLTPDGVNGIAFYNSKQAWWGVTIGPAGDINDDGIADFAIGTAVHDQYVYYGTKRWQQHWYKTVYDVSDLYNE